LTRFACACGFLLTLLYTGGVTLGSMLAPTRIKDVAPSPRNHVTYRHITMRSISYAQRNVDARAVNVTGLT